MLKDMDLKPGQVFNRVHVIDIALSAEADYKAAHPEERRRSELGQVKARLEAMPA